MSKDDAEGILVPLRDLKTILRGLEGSEPSHGQGGSYSDLYRADYLAAKRLLREYIKQVESHKDRL